MPRRPSLARGEFITPRKATALPRKTAHLAQSRPRLPASSAPVPRLPACPFCAADRAALANASRPIHIEDLPGQTKRGRTGFDLVLKAQTACRGRSVGLFKSSDQKNNSQLRRSGTRGLIDRDVPGRTPAKARGRRQQAGPAAERPRRRVNSTPWSLGWKYRAGPALKPESSRPDTHVVVCGDIAGDRGSTPLASNLRLRRSPPRRSLSEAGPTVSSTGGLGPRKPSL